MRCEQKREGCMFYREKRCDILQDTHFKNGKPCPFFKQRPHEAVVERVFGGMVYRSIVGYHGKYYVSEDGKVVNWMGRSIKAGMTNGKPFVHLVDDITRTQMKKSVAVIVADAYIPGAGHVAYHDGDPSNCNRWNLYRVGDE